MCVRCVQTVQLLSPTIDRSECSAALSEENMSKNRFKNVLPGKMCTFVLVPPYSCLDMYV